ncbi:RTA1-domain-containing protein [Zopfia rhizophila CBS 207.26]|uniref:RTA1-domain-containing protein n=1 Tax=Zopfia rhizophila CBS 207.26 TaxID=1314779 RepID=A0A6A6DTK8_9PEZI|nr:RTA1-domain-containing protein [Zopfia rhizophila CBS 207.26]
MPTNATQPDESHDDETVFSLYHYEPSFPAAVVFVALFGGSTLFHLVQIFSKKTWFFVPFFVGGCFEISGFVGRAISARETYPNYSLMPYIIQSVLLLLGPTLYAASIYMLLGRLIRLLGASKYSLIRVEHLTKYFVVGDVLSFLTLYIGGGLLAAATEKSQQDLGNNIIIVGLGIQIIFFSFFMIVTCIFHYRILLTPTRHSMFLTVPWPRAILILYIASALIMIRSAFRMAEYVMGMDSELQSKEVYLYVLDACLMAGVTVLYNVFHPSQVISADELAKARGEFEGIAGEYEYSGDFVRLSSPKATP